MSLEVHTTYIAGIAPHKVLTLLARRSPLGRGAALLRAQLPAALALLRGLHGLTARVRGPPLCAATQGAVVRELLRHRRGRVCQGEATAGRRSLCRRVFVPCTPPGRVRGAQWGGDLVGIHARLLDG